MVRLTGNSDEQPGIDLGSAKQINAFHSKTSPGTFHFAIQFDEPVIFKRFGGEVTVICTCPGFHNHRKCWHTALVAGDDVEGDGSGE